MNQNQMIQAGLSEVLRKEEFLKKISDGRFSMPETPEEVLWFEEYMSNRATEILEYLKNKLRVRYY